MPNQEAIFLSYVGNYRGRDSSQDCVCSSFIWILGRSVSACQKAFEKLISRTSQPYPNYGQPFGNLDPGATTSKSKKRTQPGSEGPMTVERIIQPRTSDFSTVNEPYNPSFYAPSASVPTPALGEPLKKKRGRPSKAEHEIRVAEYAARGEPYPAPRKSKSARQSTEASAPTATMLTPTAQGSGNGKLDSTPKATEAGEEGLDSPAKKRSRPSTAENITKSYGFGGPAEQANQFQHLPPAPVQHISEGTVTNTLSDSQTAADNEFQGLLLSQIQEHAARLRPTDPASLHFADPKQTDGSTTFQQRTIPDQRAWKEYKPPASS